MKKVILVGTMHSIQRGGNIDFGSYVESLVVKYSPQTIAEELDESAASVANKIAISAGLQYLIIEPTPEERRRLAIPSLNEIEFSIHMEFDDLNSIEAKNQCAMLKENSYRAREREWFNRLNGVANWPVLVICGAAHYQPFAELLKEKGFEVIYENEYWVSRG